MHNRVLRGVKPEATHEVVLGDLFGSQWIPDDEFLHRVHRYKDIIFKDVRSLPVCLEFLFYFVPSGSDILVATVVLID